MSRRRKKKGLAVDLVMAIIAVIVYLAITKPAALEAALHYALFGIAVAGSIVGLVFFYRHRKPRAIRPAQNDARQSPRKHAVSIPPASQKVENFDVHLSSDDPVASKWTLDLINSLDWKLFEELCAGYFQAKGRNARVTSLGADGGVDILLYEENQPDKVLGVVQCKAWSKKQVGVKEVRELLGVMTDTECPLGVYLTTSGFTTEARAFSAGKHITLMDSGKLLELILKLPGESQSKLLKQVTTGNYTTPSCPKCGTKLVTRTSRKGANVGQHFWGCSNFPRCRYTMRKLKPG